MAFGLKLRRLTVRWVLEKCIDFLSKKKKERKKIATTQNKIP